MHRKRLVIASLRRCGTIAAGRGPIVAAVMIVKSPSGQPSRFGPSCPSNAPPPQSRRTESGTVSFILGRVLPKEGTPDAKIAASWSSWPIVLMPATVIGLLLAVRLWNARPKRPGSLRDGRWLVGYGVASAVRMQFQLPSKATVRMGPDGKVLVRSDITDIGTGTYTIVAQVAADTLGVPLSHVKVEIGQSPTFGKEPEKSERL